MTPTMTSWELVNRVHAMLGERHKDGMYEGILTPDYYVPESGARVANFYAPISGVLVANEPSVDALRLAISTGKNCIVCREHPYYLFGEFWSNGLQTLLADDPIFKAKRQLVEDHRLVIIRLASLWDAAKPKWFSSALARALGWQAEAESPGDQRSTVYCNIPKTTLLGLAKAASARLKAQTLRMVGDPKLPIARVAVIHGLAFPTLVLSNALQDLAVDAVVTGSTPEVDFCTTYIRDVIAAGRKIGFVQVGYEKSDYPGAVEVAQWLKTVLPGFPIDVQPATKELCWFA